MYKIDLIPFANYSCKLIGYIKFLFFIASILFTLSSFAKEAQPTSEDPELEKRLISLSENLRCLVCQNETIAESRADFSNDMRREIREQMKANKSDAEIIEFLVARYGDFVLYDPPFKSTTFLLWFGPLILFISGVAALMFYLRRRRTQIEEDSLSDSERLQAETLIKAIDKEKV